MKLSIVVLTPGPAEGKAIPINVQQFLIGRDPGCQLRPASILISKRHCALLRRDEKVFVRDFGSTNGTFVNDRQIKGEIELLDGDELRVGPLTFKVNLEASPTTAAKVPPPKPAADQAASPPAEKAAQAASPEDEAAAQLLAMQDGDAPDAGPQTKVPEGTTQFEIPAANATDKGAANKDKEKAKKPSGDTSNAAKSILEKYLKRPRS
jgi:pSer/pThr/pTyr-binding forkhead associated (FHA) protein